LDWLRRLVSYWANEFDWRAWERKLNALNQFTWDGIHFVHQRAASGAGVPLILTHGWPSSFLDYLDMLPMLVEDFDVVVPSLPGYGFSPRPPRGRHPHGGRRGALRHRALVRRSEPGLGRNGTGLQRDPAHQAADRRVWTEYSRAGLAAYLGEKWHSPKASGNRA
jgi:pimeloyl-ACP methyl ester carboxylesterase